MKFIDEYRDPTPRPATRRRSPRITTRPWTLMEVCGGQTHAIVKFGVDELLPQDVTLVHGPGCPVCVTPLELIEKAIEIASRPGRDVLLVRRHAAGARPAHAICSSVKARGGDVRIVYSPLDAVKLARATPDAARSCSLRSASKRPRRPTRWLCSRRRSSGLPNFSMLVSHVLVPPAMEAILSAAGSRVQGFLAAGHVCTVMGFTEYEPLAAQYRGARSSSPASSRWTSCRASTCASSSWRRAAPRSRTSTRARSGGEGNVPAQQLVNEVFEVVPRKWRGVGEIPASGLGLARPTRVRCRARFGVAGRTPTSRAECMQRPDHAGRDEAARVPGLRHALHARASARRHHGVVRGRVRRLLPLPSSTARPQQRGAESWPRPLSAFQCPLPIGEHTRAARRTAAAAS